MIRRRLVNVRRAALVVHRVVRALAAREPHAVERHDLAGRHHRNAGLAVAIGEQVGTLRPSTPKNCIALILAGGARRRHHRLKARACSIRRARPAAAAPGAPNSLSSKRSDRSPSVAPPVRRGQFESHLVGLLQIERAAGRGHWRAAVGENAGQLDARARACRSAPGPATGGAPRPGWSRTPPPATCCR